MTFDEVRKLTEKELLIKAQNLRGPEVVCEDWPCGYSPDAYGLQAAHLVLKDGEQWITDYYGIEWPVILDGYDWPPKWNEEEKDYSADVKPVPDYPNNIEVSWELFQKARSGPNFWDFCFWLERLAGSTVWTVVMGHLSPRMITEAFVLAETNKEVDDG